MDAYRTQIILGLIAAGTLVCLLSPIGGYIYILNGMQQAMADNALPTLVGKGLLIAGTIWMVGALALVWILTALHKGDQLPIVDTDPCAAIVADPAAQVKPSITVTPTRRAISRYQWSDIMSWAAVDDDVKAITERYDFSREYELVDAIPGCVLDDGRYVPDISIEFMYPAGARSALTSVQINQTIRCPSD